MIAAMGWLKAAVQLIGHPVGPQFVEISLPQKCRRLSAASGR